MYQRYYAGLYGLLIATVPKGDSSTCLNANFPFLRGTTFQQSLNLLTWFTFFFRVFAGFSRFNVDVFLYKPLKNYFMMLHHFGSWDTSMNSWSILVKGSLDSSPQRDFCNFNLPVILRFAIQNHQKNQNPEWCCDFTKNSMDGFLSTTLA